MENILQKIIDVKKNKIEFYKKKYNENQLLNDIKNINNFINFKDKIVNRTSEKKISIIAEIKKESPSAGEIVKNFDPVNIAKVYFKNGASFLSILTEENFFKGHLDHIRQVKEKFNIPILCKDFFIDTFQIPLAKSYGADCILIILSAVDKVLAKDLYQAANNLNITTLIEVHNEYEAELALSFEQALIGINNRNLKTLKISLETTTKLSKILIPHKNPLISESGISTTDNIKYIFQKCGIQNFLIGESLLKSKNIAAKLFELAQISVEK